MKRSGEEPVRISMFAVASEVRIKTSRSPSTNLPEKGADLLPIRCFSAIRGLDFSVPPEFTCQAKSDRSLTWIMDKENLPLRQLGVSDPPAVIADNTGATSPFFFTCDHAGRRIPGHLGSLGVAEEDLARHIAWDIGAGEVTRLLSVRLGATGVRQRYSRLVVDCNRPPGHVQSMASISEYTRIPGNAALSKADIAARMQAIFWPYHHAIAAELDRRLLSDVFTAMIAMHSFTPAYMGETRRWQAGVLHGRDSRLALLVKEGLEKEGLIVGDNEPYSLSDESDFTIPYHAERRGLPYVELEIRQDLIGDASGQEAWAERLGRILPWALDRFRSAFG